jgi:tetratricopeptide (TPR) repeat protein
MWIHGVAFPFGLLLPIAVAGFVTIAGRRDPRLRASEKISTVLLAVLAAGYALAVIAFFPAGRYRIPVVPLLILPAAGGIALWTEVAKRRVSSLLLPAGIAVAVGVLSNLGLPAMSRSFNSDAYSDLGFSYQEKGKLEEARREYQKALQIDSGNMEATNNLGTIFLIQEKPEDAKPYFLRVLSKYPDDRKALVNLGSIYLRNQEPYRAGHYYTLAQKSDPLAGSATEGARLASHMADQLEAERMRSDPDGFLTLLQSFLRDEPENDFLYFRLLQLLEEAGRYEQALAVVRIKMGQAPDDSGLRLTAARLLERLGRPGDARRVLNGGLP